MWHGSTRDDIRLCKMDLFITARCTLRCRRCSNLMQYYQTQTDERLEDIALGLERAFSLIDFTDHLLILGGEPTLHPDLAVILDTVARFREHIGCLVLTTNGTVKPSGDAVDALKRNGVQVRISRYPRIEDRQVEITKYLLSQGLDAEILPCQWTARTQRVDGDGSIFFRHCHRMLQPCVTLRGTKLWYCEFAANAHALGCDSEYIDLSRPVSKEDVYDYLDPQKPFGACRYCSGGYSDIKLEAGAEQCPVPMRWSPWAP